jgi:hypothetical protein
MFSMFNLEVQSVSKVTTSETKTGFLLIETFRKRINTKTMVIRIRFLVAVFLYVKVRKD